jgi:hypothetical protein
MHQNNFEEAERLLIEAQGKVLKEKMLFHTTAHFNTAVFRTQTTLTQSPTRLCVPNI